MMMTIRNIKEYFSMIVGEKVRVPNLSTSSAVIAGHGVETKYQYQNDTSTLID